MTITKNNFEILKAAALLSGERPDVKKAIAETERAAEMASKKTSAYIMERRKQDKNYCR